MHLRRNASTSPICKIAHSERSDLATSFIWASNNARTRGFYYWRILHEPKPIRQVVDELAEDLRVFVFWPWSGDLDSVQRPPGGLGHRARLAVQLGPC